MANNEIKTNAEIYREQRKERLAKAQKKKTGKSDKIIRILVKTICILLVAGVVLYGVGSMLTKVFCLPQKVLTVATYEDEKINAAEYNYYYMSLYNQMATASQQIDSYYGAGAGAAYTGFDTTSDPADQDYIGQDAPEGVETWADYFRLMAPEKAIIQRIVYAEAMSEEAKKAGFELDEAAQKEIDETIEERMKQIIEAAEEQDFSINNYISKSNGEGLTEKTYRELLNRDLVVEKYLTWYDENTNESISMDEVNAYYKEHRDEIDLVSTRLFAISYAEPTEDADKDDPTYSKAEAKKLANEFKDKVTDEASFVSLAKEYALPSQKDSYAKDSATLAENVGKSSISAEKLANWLFEDGRAAGDIAVIDEEDSEVFYIAYILTPPSPDKNTAGADVRHILVQAETTKENSAGEEVELSQAEIDKNFADAKEEAEKILKEWKSGKANETTFAALATEKTDDTGSASTGGLYEDITSTSSYVPEFLDWALDSHKVGDTGIIKTDYGYHVMYFVGADKTEKWENDVRSAIAADKFEDYSNNLYDTVAEKIEKSNALINFFVKSNEKLISNYVAYYASSASSSSSITY